jgi:phosphomannomutase
MGIFKAYDIRGVVPKDLTADLAYKIGRAAPLVLDARTIVVGRDMRVSSEEFASALMRGIVESGCDAVDMGLCSTSMNYFATGFGGYDGGVMVTASHNPKDYNGFKFSRAGAAPVSYETGYAEVERMVAGTLPPPAATPGTKRTVDHWPDYKRSLLGFAEGIAPLEVVVDAGNGMAGMFMPDLFASLPCKLHPMYFELDGTFPNHEANPLKKENIADLQKKVREVGADLGIAFDGDSDRCMFIDETGAAVSSDLITLMIALEALRTEPGAAIVYDLRSSRIVPEEIARAGGVPVETRVGHSFMKAIMREHRAPVGGELSGHYYFRDQYYSDSAETTMLLVLRLLSRSGKKMSELIRPMRKYHQTGEINFEVANKEARIAALEKAFADGKQSHLDGLTVRYPSWWFNVRMSNTEPVLRLNLEADRPETRDAQRRRVEAIIKG